MIRGSGGGGVTPGAGGGGKGSGGGGGGGGGGVVGRGGGGGWGGSGRRGRGRRGWTWAEEGWVGGGGGGTIVAEGKVAGVGPEADVVHGLKEPTLYESTIPGRCIRIGALHLGDFHAESGLAAMLKKGNFSGVVDGSYMGGHS